METGIGDRLTLTANFVLTIHQGFAILVKMVSRATEMFCIWKRERWERVVGVTGNRSGSGVFLNNDILDITLNIGKINIGGDVEYLTVHRVS